MISRIIGSRLVSGFRSGRKNSRFLSVVRVVIDNNTRDEVVVEGKVAREEAIILRWIDSLSEKASIESFSQMFCPFWMVNRRLGKVYS